MEPHETPRCIMGNDYYVSNEYWVCADGRITASGEIFGYYVIIRQYDKRYHLPIMHTETNIVELGAVNNFTVLKNIC